MGQVKADGITWYIRGTNFPMSHESWLRSMVNPFSGELFLDIGAHVGTWAIRATRSFRHVVAFEPNPETNRILRTNVTLNRLSNIRVIQAALSDRVGEIATVESRVRVRTLDSFEFRPSLVKIDTEGNELRVLQGALETLRKRPGLIIETHYPESVGRIRSLLEPYGYSIKEISRLNRFNQVQSWLLCN